MPFIKIEGVTGKVFVPESGPATPKKHNCPDCHSCAFCSDERCSLCLGKKTKKEPCKCPNSNPSNHQK